MGIPDIIVKRSNMKTLIVEDDFISRKLMVKYLSDYGETDVAVDGEEAVEVLRMSIEEGKPYDLLCLDIMLPKMDGHEVLKSVRKCEYDNDIRGLDGVKVIMTSALGDSKNVLGAFKEGCESYLIKPIKKMNLLDEMKKFELIKA